MSSIPNWLSYQALTKGDRPALYFAQQKWTYAELDALASEMAIAIAQHGVTCSTCAGILMSNCPDYVILLHALTRLGAIAALINTRLNPREIAWQLQDCQAELLIYDRTTATLIPSDSVGRKWRSLDIEDLKHPFTTNIHYPLQNDIDLDAIQSIIYTSGTTGNPKGVQLTYGNHWHSAVASAFNLGIERSDRWLLCLPLYHVGGLAIVWRSAIAGTSVVLHQRFEPEAIIRAISTDSITTISLVPTMLARILDCEEFSTSLPYWQNLRGILLGGAAPHRLLVERCLKLNLPIMPTYGLTEAASQVTTLLPKDLARKPGSSGQPLLCDRIKITAIEDIHAEVAIGEVGQILVRGANMMKGYIHQSQDTIQSGWLCTGDLGYIDSEGFLYVVSRRTDLIISGGENIYPAEIEAVLQMHPAIVEVCAIGTDDMEWGQIVTAVAVTRQAIALNELQEFCTSHQLARYKLPRLLYLVDALPKTESGKISRQKVRESFHITF
ncbi:o-succinylbenzoate--CoA ligase [Pseudanabaena sp. PCC 6802]|uniref:o-succinylbenzoate--CoA ligase n=1 Tax=Pseudanabaena sp. PCC 6802 TaxID=118173 RepID=UPI000347D798|nr:o-succinylbenzoate--CoA ligase [Pseudanabaena sp. PCC 6802]